MNEQEWLTEMGRPQWMADALSQSSVPRTKAGHRRLRLFACACCRVTWPLLEDWMQSAVAIAEDFANGRASKDELNAAHDAVSFMTDDSYHPNTPTDVRVAIEMAVAATEPKAYAAAFAVIATVMPFAGRLPAGNADEYACKLMRCVFGNPFRETTFEDSWRSSTAVAVARGISAERAFDRLPILADALQDAGCEDADVLGHCHHPGPHAYGCWVVDAVLGIK